MANEDPETTYSDIRRGAEVHRQVRQRARKFIRPGLTMTEIAEFIEDGTRALVEQKGFESGDTVGELIFSNLLMVSTRC
jgi:methionyl aminopeptidase